MREVPDLGSYRKTYEKTSVSTEDGAILPGVRGVFYVRNIDGRNESLGMFSLGGKPIFCAWGWKDEPHCGWHAVSDGSGGWLPPRPGCPDIQVLSKEGRPVGFRIRIKGGARKFLLDPSDIAMIPADA